MGVSCASPGTTELGPGGVALGSAGTGGAGGEEKSEEGPDEDAARRIEDAERLLRGSYAQAWESSQSKAQVGFAHKSAGVGDRGGPNGKPSSQGEQSDREAENHDDAARSRRRRALHQQQLQEHQASEKDSETDTLTASPPPPSSSSPSADISEELFGADGLIGSFDASTVTASHKQQHRVQRSGASSLSSSPSSSCVETLWETTGLEGHSVLREVSLRSGTVLRERTLEDPTDFGEGMTRLGGKIYQVLWRTAKTYVYDVAKADAIWEDAEHDKETGGAKSTNAETAAAETAASSASSSSSSSSTSDLVRARAPIPRPYRLRNPRGNGWGLASDGEHLILGDATDRLTVLDPKTMRVLRTVHASDDGGPVVWLNELEYDPLNETLLANVWSRECVARVDPHSGAVLAWIDARGLRRRAALEAAALGVAAPRMDVLNGIALDPCSGRIFLTGKKWPFVYQVEFERLPDDPEQLRLLREHCVVRETRGFV